MSESMFVYYMGLFKEAVWPDGRLYVETQPRTAQVTLSEYSLKIPLFQRKVSFKKINGILKMPPLTKKKKSRSKQLIEF